VFGAFGLVRTAVFAVGVLMVVGGFGLMAADPVQAGAGLWSVILGGAAMIVPVLERRRYRSEAAERSNEPIGPGGGETPGEVDARFRPTEEVFIDPTTGRQMRVLVDPRSGERRYVAEA
jgi:hypothetical protein